MINRLKVLEKYDETNFLVDIIKNVKQGKDPFVRRSELKEEIQKVITYVDKRFDDVDRRFDEVIGYVNKRFEQTDKRLDEVIGYLKK